MRTGVENALRESESEVEVGDDYGQGGACAWTSEDLAEEIARASEPRGCLSEDVRVMAAEACMRPSSTVLRTDSGGRTEGVTSMRRDKESGAQDVNKHGGARFPAASVSVKTLKYSGKADWEAFHAQFELLAPFRGRMKKGHCSWLYASRMMLWPV